MQFVGDPMSWLPDVVRPHRPNGAVAGGGDRSVDHSGGAERATQHRDAGSVLPLVLAMVVIGSLIVIPTMTYAMTVMKANTVLSEKTIRTESAKAGLRLALADPVALYDACGDLDHGAGPTTPIQLAPISMDGVNVSTVCYFIDYASAQSAEELRVGVTSTLVGTAPPEELKGSSWCAPNPLRTVPCTFQPTDPNSSSEWLTMTTLEVRDRQDLAAEPPRARAQPPLAGRQPDAERVPYVHGLLSGHVPRPGRARRPHLLHLGDLLLRERGPHRRWCIGRGRSRPRPGMHQRSGSHLLRRERTWHPQHEWSRSDVGARGRRTCRRRQLQRCSTLVALQQAIRGARRHR